LQLLLHDHKKQIGYESDPDLDFNGIGALSIEVSQREVLLDPLDLQSKNKGREIIPTFVRVNQRREVN
jgi:hypothetical protein